MNPSTSPSNTSPIRITWGHKVIDLEQHIDDILPWLAHEDRSYFRQLFGQFDVEQVFMRWLSRPSSEYSLRRLRVLLEDQRIAGGYIAVAGSELQGCRRADLLALARHHERLSYRDLRDRIDSFGELFAPVEDHDFFLSTLGLLDFASNRGLDYRLLDDCLHRADQGGFGRIRVDVAEQNRDLVQWYRTYGFRPIYRGKSDDGHLRYLSMSCDV